MPITPVKRRSIVADEGAGTMCGACARPAQDRQEQQPEDRPDDARRNYLGHVVEAEVDDQRRPSAQLRVVGQEREERYACAWRLCVAAMAYPASRRVEGRKAH